MYFLFAFDWYYPSGGLGDYEGSVSTIEEARTRFQELAKEYDNVQIVTVRDGALVEVSDEVMDQPDGGA